MRRFIKIALPTVLIAFAAFIIYDKWPCRFTVATPYDQVVQELKTLYPIYKFRTVTGDTAAIRRNHPAYDYHGPLWDIDVSHAEVVPGQVFQTTIINKSKFDSRTTTITVERLDANTRVTLLSKEWHGLLEMKLRDRGYERDRVGEIRARLQALRAE